MSDQINLIYKGGNWNGFLGNTIKALQNTNKTFLFRQNRGGLISEKFKTNFITKDDSFYLF